MNRKFRFVMMLVALLAIGMAVNSTPVQAQDQEVCDWDWHQLFAIGCDFECWDSGERLAVKVCCVMDTPECWCEGDQGPTQAMNCVDIIDGHK